jgi:pilus assembly protein CpaB
MAFTGLALTLAAITCWLVLHMLSAGGYSHEPTRPVVVAAHELIAGKPLTDRDLKVVEWPSSSLPEGAFSKAEALLKPEPRVPTSGMVKGEPILRVRLASPQAGPGLSALVSPNRRAVAIQVDKDLAAVRLLYPGAHVDIMATFTDPVARLVSTRTVLENVKVLAVGTFADVEAVRRGRAEADNARSGFSSRDDEAEAVVTFEVTPQDAERVSLAAHEGKIDVALRSAADLSMTQPPGMTSVELFSGFAPQRAVRRAGSQSTALGAQTSAATPRRRTAHAATASGIEVINVHAR